MRDYIAIARPSHWFKNIFVVPGVVMAVLLTHASLGMYWLAFVIGMVATCLIASANYVLNEWIDSKYDRFHPVKKARPLAAGRLSFFTVAVEYIVLATVGLLLGRMLSGTFLITLTLLLVMGILYNVEPVRTKDKVYLDVLSESINNPIRFLLGWFMVTDVYWPPSSLLLGYWMAGAFLMAIKRYGEYVFIDNPEVAAAYRKSFRFYTRDNLLISAFFYATCSSFFMGIFLVKYRVELILSLPFLAFLFAWYLRIGFKPNSIVQNPELLYQEKKFIVYFIFVVLLMFFLLLVDMSSIQWFLDNTFLKQ